MSPAVVSGNQFSAPGWMAGGTWGVELRSLELVDVETMFMTETDGGTCWSPVLGGDHMSLSQFQRTVAALDRCQFALFQAGTPIGRASLLEKLYFDVGVAVGSSTIRAMDALLDDEGHKRDEFLRDGFLVDRLIRSISRAAAFRLVDPAESSIDTIAEVAGLGSAEGE